MLKRSILAALCVLLLAPAWSALGADPTLVGWWWFEEGAGTVAHDSSMYGNDGTLMNGPIYVEGYFGKALQFDGTNDFVQVPHDPSLCVTDGVTVMAWVNMTRYEFPGGGYQGIISKGNAPRSYSLYTTSAGILHFSIGPGGAYVGTTSTGTVPRNEWAHVCAMVRSGTQYYYINGTAQGSAGAGTVLPGTTSTANVLIGDTEEASREFGGMMDDVRIYNRSMELAEVLKIMTGFDLVSGSAVEPAPEDGATDVPQDVALAWTPGEFAATHDVYLGTSLEDVNAADRANPLGILASQGQTATEFDPEGLLPFGQTYYWRVDEVNAAPDNTIFKGGIWSFTVEPFGYPIANVLATASSSQTGMGPENTVNGSGLNAADEHSTVLTQMWMSSGIQPNWIQYELDGVYKLHQMLVWNSNQLIEAFLGFGAKDVTVEYSVDGEAWMVLEGVPEFTRATGSPTYKANTTVDFGGAMAKFVKLTINANWGGVAPQTGLSEVRFSYVPVQARQPEPAAAATGVSVDSELNWRPGREAESHEVYLGTDADALTLADTVAGHSYIPAALDFGTTYFWKVNELGGAGPYEGEVWSFATEEFAIVEDFESYNDDDNRIYDSWIDGLTDAAKGGSQVGYDVSPFAEKTVIHGGGQSMPLMYDNSASPFISEAERTFDSPQNWTTNGADTLSLHVSGNMPAFVETATGSVLMNAIGTDIWNTADQFRFAYKTLNGNGTMVARVDSIYNSNVWAKGGVMIRQSIEPGSVHAFMPITPGGSGAGNGASFQRRLAANGASTNNDNTGAVVAAPYWVKIERNGNNFSGSISPDGITWTQLGTAQTITMTGPVLIGLALCSHDAAVATGAEFSNVSFTGNVTGAWQVAEIGAAQPAGNSVEGLYVTIKDSSGKSKTVMNPDTAATARGGWTQWTIPLSEFTSAGVKMNAVKSLTIGVGNKTAPVMGGAGTLFIDDIGYGSPADGQ